MDAAQPKLMPNIEKLLRQLSPRADPTQRPARPGVQQRPETEPSLRKWSTPAPTRGPGATPAAIQRQVGRGVQLPPFPRTPADLKDPKVAMAYGREVQAYSNLVGELRTLKQQGLKPAQLNAKAKELAKAFAKDPDHHLTQLGMQRAPPMPGNLRDPLAMAEYDSAMAARGAVAGSLLRIRDTQGPDAAKAALRNTVNNKGTPLELDGLKGHFSRPPMPGNPRDEGAMLEYREARMGGDNLTNYAAHLKRNGMSDTQLEALLPQLKQDFKNNPLAADLTGVKNMPPPPTRPTDPQDVSSMLKYQADMERHTDYANRARSLRSLGFDDERISHALAAYQPNDFSSLTSQPVKQPRLPATTDRDTVEAYLKQLADFQNFKGQVSLLRDLGLSNAEIRTQLGLPPPLAQKHRLG